MLRIPVFTEYVVHAVPQQCGHCRNSVPDGFEGFPSDSRTILWVHNPEPTLQKVMVQSSEAEVDMDPSEAASRC